MDSSYIPSTLKGSQAVFLIEGASVCMAVFHEQEKGAYVTYSTINHIAAHPKDQRRDATVRIANVVSMMLRDFERKHTTDVSRAIEQVSFFYTYPILISSRERIRSVNTDRRGVLTEQVLQTLLQKAEESFFASVKPEQAPEHAMILHRVISETKLNGYPVSEYFGRSYHEFSAHVSFSSVSEVLVTRLADAVHSIYRRARINHFDALVSALEAIEQSQTVPERFLCAFIGRSASHIAFVNKTMPFTRKHFDTGGERLVRNLSHELRVTQAVTRSFCEAQRAGMLHGKHEERFVSAIKNIGVQWLAEALSVRQEISEDFMLPKEIYLVTSGETDRAISEYMPGTTQDAVADHQIIILKETLFPRVKVETHVSLGVFERALIHATIS